MTTSKPFLPLYTVVSFFFFFRSVPRAYISADVDQLVDAKRNSMPHLFPKIQKSSYTSDPEAGLGDPGKDSVFSALCVRSR
jgi:hypothetical protein